MDINPPAQKAMNLRGRQGATIATVLDSGIKEAPKVFQKKKKKEEEEEEEEEELTLKMQGKLTFINSEK